MNTLLMISMVNLLLFFVMEMEKFFEIDSGKILFNKWKILMEFQGNIS
jgi:hypothetical protein